MSELKVNKETDFVKMLRYEKELETENEDLKQQNNELRQKIEKVREYIESDTKDLNRGACAMHIRKRYKELKSIIGESE